VDNVSSRVIIDEIDVEILKTLLEDPRTSFAAIAKQCNISINCIRKRFKRLEGEGVIKGSILQINPKCWGYNCIAYLLIQAVSNNLENVMEFLTNNPQILQTFQQIGKTNIHCLVTLRNVDELAHVIENVKKHPSIINVDAIIWIDITQMDHPENLVIEPFDGLLRTSNLDHNDTDSKHMIKKYNNSSNVAREKIIKENCEFDEIDQNILCVLSENSRIHFKKIAEQLDISIQSVSRRYNRLRKGVSPYSSITLDLRKLGYVGTALFLIKVSPEQNATKVFQEILKIPNVITAIRALGNIDIIIAGPFSYYENIFKLNQSITGISGVMQTELLWAKPFSEWPLNVFSKILQKQV
jgi:DNA-binding Lrp family transcriptional regulator